MERTEPVRLDRKVKRRLARLAKANRRTLSAELAIAVEAHLLRSATPTKQEA